MVKSISIYLEMLAIPHSFYQGNDSQAVETLSSFKRLKKVLQFITILTSLKRVINLPKLPQMKAKVRGIKKPVRGVLDSSQEAIFYLVCRDYSLKVKPLFNDLYHLIKSNSTIHTFENSASVTMSYQTGPVTFIN